MLKEDCILVCKLWTMPIVLTKNCSQGEVATNCLLAPWLVLVGRDALTGFELATTLAFCCVVEGFAMVVVVALGVCCVAAGIAACGDSVVFW